MTVTKVSKWAWTGLAGVSLLGVHMTHAESLLGDDDFLLELPVYISVTKLPQNKREMPAALTVIDREMIDASGAVNIADLLRLVPGFQVMHFHDGDGPRAIVMSHGFSDSFARRMQVLLDGVSVYKNSTGGPDWYDLPITIDDIERIEVIRGPNAATYGTNSVSAVINIVTRGHGQQKGTRISTLVGERGYQRYGIRHGESIQNLQLRTSIEYDKNTGLLDKEEAGRLNDDMLTRKLNLRADYRAGVNDYLRLSFGTSNGVRQVGKAHEIFDPVRDRRMDHQMVDMSWKRIIDTDTDVELKFTHYEHRMFDRPVYNILTVPIITAIDDRRLVSSRDGVEFINRFRLSEDTRLVWGAEVREDRAEAVNYFYPGNSYKMQSRNAYFNLEWRPSYSWVFNFGNMTENNSLYGTHHSPRLAANYLFGDGMYIRGARARAHRMPMFLEYYANYNIDARFDDGSLFASQILYSGFQDIKAETQDSVEIAFGVQREIVSYDVRMFHNTLNNNIFVTKDRSEVLHDIDKYFINNEKVKIYGIELGLKYRADENVGVAMNYSYAEASGRMYTHYNREAPVRIDYQDMSDTVPLGTFSMLLDIMLAERQRLGIGIYYTSSIKLIGAPDRDVSKDVLALDVNYRRNFKTSSLSGFWNVLLRDVNGPFRNGQEHVWRDKQAFLGIGIDF